MLRYILFIVIAFGTNNLITSKNYQNRISSENFNLAVRRTEVSEKQLFTYNLDSKNDFFNSKKALSTTLNRLSTKKASTTFNTLNYTLKKAKKYNNTKNLKNNSTVQDSIIKKVPKFSCGNYQNENTTKGQKLLIEDNTPLLTTPKIIRLAVLVTAEYSNYHISLSNKQQATINQKKEIVINAIKNSITKINDVFKRDLGIEFKLVDNNDRLVFLDPETDGLTNNNNRLLIEEGATLIANIIGTDNYDIGHTFSTSNGGLSARSTAFKSRKAYGVTGSKDPIGKVFDIDYLAHEIGHQLGATHTQNSSCARDRITAVEPGSGITIMGYAGICHIQNSNLATTSIPYFHSVSIGQIQNYLNSLVTTSARILNQNNSFSLIPPKDYFIPKETPFEIKITTTSNENNIITYACEQIDIEPAAFPPSSTTEFGPVFSPQPPSTNTTISFPKKEFVINNNLNSNTGVVSSIPRKYAFAASARNNSTTNPQIVIKKFTVSVVDAPAFKIISQNEKDIIWIPNTTKTITWNMEGTTTAPINVKNVDILLSTNNGKSFDHVLTKGTPNDGTQTIIVPNNIQSNECRIKIKAIDNIFYTLNTERFAITAYKNYSYSFNEITEISDRTITTTINVPESINYEDLEVFLDLTYNEIQQLKISLLNPENKEVFIWDANCSNEKIIQATFKDQEQIVPLGPLYIGEKCESIVNGLRAPIETLATLKGETKGIWKLKITSQNSKLTGILNNWSLSFKAQEDLNDNIISPLNKNISYYPNPIVDVMTVEINDPLALNNKIDIFSTNGMLKKTILLDQKPNQQIDLSNLNSGLYMAIFTSGKNTSTQKIVIK